MTRVVLNIGGMTCASCSQSLEKALGNAEGVSSASVSLPRSTAAVEYDESRTSVSELSKIVRKAGFKVLDSPASDMPADIGRDLAAAVLFSIPIIYLAMGPMIGLPLGPLGDDDRALALMQLALCVPVLLAGRRFYTRGFPALARRTPNMDTLVALGTSAAVIYSLYITSAVLGGSGDVHELYYDSAAMIIALVMVGKYLESRSRKRTGDSVRRLLDLAPGEASVMRDGREVRIPVEELRAGDAVVIRPGESIPADGTVTEGQTAVDESMLTGESVPADRTAGDRVFSGTVNVSGSILMTAEGVGEDTVLRRIVRMVEEAQGSKAPISRMADRVAGVFVPAVMTVAIAACLLWLAAGRDIGFSLTVLISVLVISCPCALGLATPLAIIVGTGKAAEMGILFKDAESMETAGRADTVVLDKTGTVTEGRPRVTDIVGDVLGIAASAESSSEHPLAKAVVERAVEEGLDVRRPSGFRAHVGGGIECELEGVRVLIGNRALVEEKGADPSAYAEEHAVLSEEGKTVMFVAADGEVLGLIAVADTIKDSSRPAVERMRGLGLDVVMITGDSEGAARRISAEAGIPEYRHSARPDDKAAAVGDLQSEGRTVIMAGDGINDAPALARADVGFAVGSGTDIAIDSADVVLIGDDLGDMATAVEISRATLGNIKQNLFLAFCYNAVCIPIAAGLPYLLGMGMIHGMPMIAAAAMSVSSVSVVLNSLRLTRFSPGAEP
ncbi:MAG: heavy metal translocating P-type ATPase [Candidatus Methanomethylophilaceae archaeon]|jgi:Cu+-exporting ATPase|nr:heavy metal translocating P-type ATPase [Candidatus Methanomethylophilaceae archaeon]NLF34089.1 copper-translocating P-type ATPase [Thermoplasmatales archaeon]